MHTRGPIDLYSYSKTLCKEQHREIVCGDFGIPWALGAHGPAPETSQLWCCRQAKQPSPAELWDDIILEEPNAELQRPRKMYVHAC